jgi:hypothetical protein
LEGECKGKSIAMILGAVSVDIPVNRWRILKAHMHAQKRSY